MTIIIEAAQMNIFKNELRLTMLEMNCIDERTRAVRAKAKESTVQCIC